MTTALIAEDEPLLAQALRAELARAWPELQLLEAAVDGDDAVERALAQRPAIVFLDIRMPGRSGLEAAEAIVEEWPADAGAVAADRLRHRLRPVRAAGVRARGGRLPAKARAAGAPGRVLRAAEGHDRAARAARAPRPAPPDDAALLGRLRTLLGAAPERRRGAVDDPAGGIGATLHMIPVDEVVYFEAADKYVRVVTARREALIRMSLRELLPRLRAERFWQIHRGTVVRADAVATATRDDSGKVFLTLRERPERLVASRLHAHLFRGM